MKLSFWKKHFIYFTKGGGYRNIYPGASLGVQWLRIRLPVQRAWVEPLVWGDPTSWEQLSLCAIAAEAHRLRSSCPTTREATQWETWCIAAAESLHAAVKAQHSRKLSNWVKKSKLRKEIQTCFEVEGFKINSGVIHCKLYTNEKHLANKVLLKSSFLRKFLIKPIKEKPVALSTLNR